MPITSYRDLEAWQLAMDFVVHVYRLTKHFPSEELYGLTSQLRRAAIGVPSNISEGHRQGTKAYLRFVVIALGSLAEADPQLELAQRLTLAPVDEIKRARAIAASVARLLHGLKRALKNRTA